MRIASNSVVPDEKETSFHSNHKLGSCQILSVAKIQYREIDGNHTCAYAAPGPKGILTYAERMVTKSS
jgi:hypothetical protein